MIDEKEVKDAIKVILLDKDHYATSLNYAVNYCRYALDMTGEELRVQCLYIIGNITHWRHPKAKEVRDTIRKFGGSK